MVKRANRVQETTATTGTGTLTLAGAVARYRAFSAAFAVGDSIYYTIEDTVANDWEVGAGILLTSNTLSRVQVFSSSNANALVNFAANTKNVFCVDPAENQWPVVKNSTAANEVCTIPANTQMIVVNSFDNVETVEVIGDLHIIDPVLPAGALIKQTIYTASGIYVKATNNARLIVVELWGGGGGGASAAVNSGSAGGYSRKTIRTDSLGASENFIVGAGGAINGNATDSSFGTSIIFSAGGGLAGAVGALGGNGVNGDLNLRGGLSVIGANSCTAIAPILAAGSGVNTATGGAVQANTGAGGGGSATVGFAGASGLVIITEYA